MNISRLLKALTICAILLLVIVMGYLISQQTHQAFPFAKYTDQAQKIVLASGPSQVTLVHAGQWQVQGLRQTYPADSGKVKTLLDALKEVHVDEEISDRADRAADYEVNPGSGTRVSLQDKNGRNLAEGVFGKQAPDFNHIYFKYVKSASVYLAQGMIRGELGGVDVNGWRDHTILNLPDDQVNTLTIQTPAYKTELAKSSGTWVVNGHSANAGMVAGLVSAIAHLQADDFIDSASGPSIRINYATVTIGTPTEVHDLHLGPLDPATKRYPVALDQAGPSAWISKSKVQSLLWKQADFKAQ